MSFVAPSYKHDIFVSYSHGADAQGQPQLKDWSVAFVRALESELRFSRQFRDTLSLFIDAHDRPDQRLDPMKPLADQLEAAVGASALLMVLMSPDYQASQWCRTEREWWWNRQTAIDLAPAGRIAMVRTQPLEDPWPDGRWPRELSDGAGNPLVGYPFHTGEGLAARPLGWTQWQTGFAPDVREALVQLAGELGRKLKEVRAELERRQAEQADALRLAGGGQTIYLHGRTDQREAWERAAVALQDADYAVLPSEPDPVERDPARLAAIREQRVDLLTTCDALVLMGSSDGRAIDEDLMVVGKHDRHSARARCNRWLPCGLLDTAGEAVATRVRRNNARILQADWLDGTHEAAAAVIGRWLGEKAIAVGRG